MVLEICRTGELLMAVAVNHQDAEPPRFGLAPADVGRVGRFELVPRVSGTTRAIRPPPLRVGDREGYPADAGGELAERFALGSSGYRECTAGLMLVAPVIAASVIAAPVIVARVIVARFIAARFIAALA
jgi:hypothetical protein